MQIVFLLFVNEKTGTITHGKVTGKTPKRKYSMIHEQLSSPKDCIVCRKIARDEHVDLTVDELRKIMGKLIRPRLGCIECNEAMTRSSFKWPYFRENQQMVCQSSVSILSILCRIQ